ncbi:hypothetical protein [Ornithinicoccus halotolerans]|uniref:hypothetical protein n=1 Tax=Ornithinicoccus halotolerans TaxID=1748220 RepID=UPI001297DB9A|nr:hypothetical protein [Ornithinicoccus halotolerans]
MGQDQYDETFGGTTNNASPSREDEQQQEDARRQQGGESDEGQVSEGGSGSPNAEANRGGADSVPDTPDNNDPFDRPGSDFTDESKGGDSA